MDGVFDCEFSIFTDPEAAVEEAAFLAERDQIAYAVVSHRRNTQAQCYAVLPKSKVFNKAKILEICYANGPRKDR